MSSKLTRRRFIQCAGLVVFSLGGGCYVMTGTREETKIPPAESYLVVDAQKCQGCLSSMLACSLVHEGQENLSLSRIQVCQNLFEKFFHDLDIFQCRQYTAPACVASCPEGALAADPGSGSVRRVDRKKCTGCGACVDACPFQPKRVIVQPDAASVHAAASRKCDLCAHAPFHWDEAGGGPGGKQACVAVCPGSKTANGTMWKPVAVILTGTSSRTLKRGSTDFRDGIRPRGGLPALRLNPLVKRGLPMNWKYKGDWVPDTTGWP